MTDLERSLRRCVADLRALGCRFALVGGLAVSARAEPRLTRDADLVVSVAGDAEAEELLARLRVDGYTVQMLVEQTATGRLATARLVRAGDSLVTDLLFASSGIEPEIVDEADELFVLPDLVVPTASIGHLVALKLLARDDRNRPADADDLASLAEVAGEDDWESARRAVRLIAERGYARGRDLETALERLRSSGAY